MKILPLLKPTDQDKQELENLNKKEETQKLTDKEAARQIFLSVKNLWNCEC